MVILLILVRCAMSFFILPSFLKVVPLTIYCSHKKYFNLYITEFEQN